MSGIVNSSIGRKLVMSISGLFLVLFLLFHMCMNLVAAFSGDAYNAVCAFLGTNWYALAGTAVLALGVVVHIAYAFILTLQNRKARGENAYSKTVKPKTVEWASQNMLVLGLIVLCGLGLHLAHYWYHMMWAELAGSCAHTFPEGYQATGSVEAAATDGASWLKYWFGQPIVACVYVVWLIALWFHLTHGFWSALQTLGWNNNTWIERWECAAKWFATIVCAGFIIVVLGYAAGVFPLCGGCCGGCCA